MFLYICHQEQGQFTQQVTLHYPHNPSRLIKRGVLRFATATGVELVIYRPHVFCPDQSDDAGGETPQSIKRLGLITQRYT